MSLELERAPEVQAFLDDGKVGGWSDTRYDVYELFLLYYR